MEEVKEAAEHFGEEPSVSSCESCACAYTCAMAQECGQERMCDPSEAD